MLGKGNWYPNKIYDLLYRLGHDDNENPLSYAEVAYMLLREILIADFGLTCKHTNIGHPKIGSSDKDRDWNKPYCKDCYLRLEKVEEKVIFKGRMIKQSRFEERDNFLKKLRLEKKEITDANFESRVNEEVEKRIKILRSADADALAEITAGKSKLEQGNTRIFEEKPREGDLLQ